MLVLHGSPISNYYNKVKLALLEKGLAFEEADTPTKSTDEAVLSVSPLGKIPFLKTPQGGLCESQVIVDYLEAVHPVPALLPADPFAAAKVREIATFIDWHLEIAARQLYNSAFFGGPALSESRLASVRKELESKIAGFRRLAKFSPYVAGDTFTLADCSAFNNLPLVAMASKASFGEDLLAAGGIDHRAYVKFIGERPSAQKVVADRKAAQAKL
ncbi:glutathione S-transferase family protein [Caenimonas sedimenti]|uniref:Glutathione S-transferase family protein n=1 Tax=Caenimonas sedimenti TaxID=2596921 RepID=A0A562ZSY5_9BURK|nr:glutathione S-transferase family protein [Caenimonas sedimenti]TWO71700.1 glutathione S-transferase family protein [Caenimonas sedimenti]